MKKVLYVEANDVSRILFKKLVIEALKTSEATQLLTAKNTAEAEKLLREETFHLLVTEIYVIDGMDLLRNLRAGSYNNENKLIPAIAFSAAALNGEKDKCLRVGFNAYFTLPYKAKKVARTIDGLL